MLPNGGWKQFRRVQVNDGECGGDSELSDHAESCSHVDQRHAVPYIKYTVLYDSISNTRRISACYREDRVAMDTHKSWS